MALLDLELRLNKHKSLASDLNEPHAELLAFQNGVPNQVVLSTTKPKSSAVNTSKGSAQNSPTVSFDYSEDSLAKDILMYPHNQAPAVTQLNRSKSIKSHPLGPFRLDQKATIDRHTIAPARRTTGRGPFQTALRSSTFDVVRDIIGSIARPTQRRSYDKKQTEVDNKREQKARRDRWRLHIRFECLEDRLKSAIEFSHICNKSFLSKGSLEELVTQKSFDKEFSRWKHIPQKFIQTWKRPHSIRIETESSCPTMYQLHSRSTSELLRLNGDKTYRIIFAILTFIAQPYAIFTFVEEGICDADLPIVKNLGANGSGHHFEPRGRQATKPLQCFGPRNNGMITRFIEHQWKFLAPSFKMPDGKTIPHQSFEPEEVLPFTCWKKEGNGGFGQVYKAEIHLHHHNFDKVKVRNGIVAVKKLLSKHHDPAQNKDAFLTESEILRNISKEQHAHDHLISLLGTFSQSGQYYLIFPWADADLETYWAKIKPEPPTNDPSVALWLIEQCQGMAEALSNVHRYTTMSATTMLDLSTHPSRNPENTEHGTGVFRLFGRHGDIKPKNILWFPDRTSKKGHGTLKITDFGIARFTSENMASKREKGIVPNSLTYRSPECDLVGDQVSTQCDIWALGCVYLVFITWFFGGREAVEAFARKRMAPDEYWHNMMTDSFFTIIRDSSAVPRAKVKDSVTQQIIRLGSHGACTKAFTDLLHLVQQEMVIIQKEAPQEENFTVSRNLDVPGTERVRRNSSGNIARDLGSLKIKCAEIPGYIGRSEKPADD